MPTEITTYYAIFLVDKYVVSASSSPIGAGNISGAGSYGYNTTATITTSPISPNYEFYRWIENGAQVSNSLSYSFTVLEEMSFLAEFKVRVTTTVSGFGEVQINGIEGLLEDHFFQGENLIIAAIPDEGYEFVNWGGASTSSSPVINVVVGTVSKNYIANFRVVGAELYVNASYGGSVVGSSLNGNYGAGEGIVLSATSNVGFHFTQWEGDWLGSFNESEAQSSYVVTGADILNETLTFTAVFEREAVELTLNTVTEGVISGVGGKVAINYEQEKGSTTGSVIPEQLIMIEAFKESGYKFVGWYTQVAGGTLITGDMSYQFEMPIADIIYYARFEVSYWTEYMLTPAGIGTLEDPYIITTANELAWVSYQTNSGLSFSSGAYFELIKDIDLDEFMWKPIGDNNTASAGSRFMGKFNGNGHKVINLTINKQHSTVGYSGLFGYIYGATVSVEGLGIENTNITSSSNFNSYCAGLVGYNDNALIERCYVLNSNISTYSYGTSYSYVGGLVANNLNGLIIDSYAVVEINVYSETYNGSYVGGLIGNNYNTNAMAERCYTSGAINIDSVNGQPSMYIGAIIGYNSFGASLINTCFNADELLYNSIGVNNANENNNFAKNRLELQDIMTYLEDNNWDFENTWIMSPQSLNNGYPVLKGVGNLVVISASVGSGQITPLGQAIYYLDSGYGIYFLTPDEGYEIKSVTVNGEALDYYTGQRTQRSYTFNDTSGLGTIEVEFRAKLLTFKDVWYFVMGSLIVLLIIVFMARKMLMSRFKRRRRIRGGIKKYKKNRYKKNK